MKIIDLLQETSEVALDMNQSYSTSGLMGITAHQIVGGGTPQKRIPVDLCTEQYDTQIDTINSNGTTAIENISDCTEPGDSLPSGS